MRGKLVVGIFTFAVGIVLSCSLASAHPEKHNIEERDVEIADDLQIENELKRVKRIQDNFDEDALERVKRLKRSLLNFHHQIYNPSEILKIARKRSRVPVGRNNLLQMKKRQSTSDSNRHKRELILQRIKRLTSPQRVYHNPRSLQHPDRQTGHRRHKKRRHPIPRQN